MKSFVVGASAGLGRALSEELARRGHDLVLLASDERDVLALTRDLALTHGVKTYPLAADLANIDAARLRADHSEAFGDLDNIFVVAGFSDITDTGSLEPGLLERLIATNFTGAVRIVNAVLDDIAAQPNGHIVGVGSVAAIRARRSNIVYGASKRALEFYFEALRHRLAGSRCRVQFYRAGYMATNMLGDRTTLLPVARPERVAQAIINRMGGPSGVRYLPAWWRWVALVFRLVPWPIFRRFDV